MVITTALIANIIGLIPTFMNALKEKHYVKRSNVTVNGLASIIVGATYFLTNPSLNLWRIPLAIILIVYGIVVVYMINTDWDKAKIIGNGKVSFILLLIAGLIQAGLIFA